MCSSDLKSTLLKIAMGRLEADAGEVTWGYEAHPGYFAQDHRDELGDDDRTAEAWLWDSCPDKDRGYVRGAMGLVLFSGDDGKKRLDALSGGEAARLVFARLSLERPNVLVLDEPTNHMDLESIEALVAALESYEGTLILVSHDRWFVSRLANRVVEIGQGGEIRDYRGTYEEYVHACGDDHLDVDTVVLKARREERARKQKDAEAPPVRRARPDRYRLERLERRREELTAGIEEAEAAVRRIDDAFCRPGFYEESGPDEIARLERERRDREAEAERLLEEWEELEREIESETAGRAADGGGR